MGDGEEGLLGGFGRWRGGAIRRVWQGSKGRGERGVNPFKMVSFSIRFQAFASIVWLSVADYHLVVTRIVFYICFVQNLDI